MRKVLSLMMIIIMIFSVYGCGMSENKEKGQKWDCSVLNSEEGVSDIIYSDVAMRTDSGKLRFRNRNEFPVHIYLYSDDADEPLILENDIPVGGVFSYEQTNRDYKYTVGFHADVEEGTDIIITAYDGNAIMEP